MIFFDIDNTLVDYSKSESGASHFIMDKYGLKLDQYGKYWKDISEKYFTKYLRQEMSFQEQGAQRIRELFEQGGRVLSLEASEKIFFEYKEELERNWVLFDDVIPCLEKLNTVNKGIASNGQAEQQNRKLQRIGIDSYFSVKKYASEMHCAKPDLQFFESLKKFCGEGDFVYVGDDLQADIYPCMELGIKAIWVNREGRKVPEGVTAICGLGELNIEKKEVSPYAGIMGRIR